MRMIKQATTKDDGRHLVYYWFNKQPVAKAESENSKVESPKNESPKS